MIREDGEDPFEVPFMQNQQPIKALGTSGAHEPFRDTAASLGNATMFSIEHHDGRGARHTDSMKIMRNVIVVLALSAVALATSACPDKGPAEKAGEKIDKAIDKTKDAAKDATK
jgi:hypothetical protein